MFGIELAYKEAGNKGAALGKVKVSSPVRATLEILPIVFVSLFK